MRPMSSALRLFAAGAFIVSTLAVSSVVLAQEPEAFVQPRHLPPHAQNLPHKPAKQHARARKPEAKTLAHALPADMSKPEAADAADAAAVQAASQADEVGAAVVPRAAAPQAQPIPAEVQQFCTSNAAVAGQARIAWEAAKLKELETKLRQRISELDAKRGEYEEWMRKREEALKKARENVVAIYQRMRPDAAALQLAAMDDEMAAAVLVKLKPASASAILNEMEPGRAARLTATMAGANPADGKKT